MSTLELSSQCKKKTIYSKKPNSVQVNEIKRRSTSCVVFLYQVLFLYSCFLDGWSINIMDGKIKLEISKKSRDNSIFNIDEFIIYNHLY